MPMMSTCPNCGQTLRVSDEMVGRKVRCPACRTVYVASAAAAVGAPPAGQVGSQGSFNLPDPNAARAYTGAPGLGLILNGLITSAIYGLALAVVVTAAIMKPRESDALPRGPAESLLEHDDLVKETRDETRTRLAAEKEAATKHAAARQSRQDQEAALAAKYPALWETYQRLEKWNDKVTTKQWNEILRIETSEGWTQPAIIQTVILGIGLLIGLSLIAAGFQMRGLRKYRNVMMNGVASMLPITFFLIGLPVGVWVLIALANPTVKNAFES